MVVFLGTTSEGVCDGHGLYLLTLVHSLVTALGCCIEVGRKEWELRSRGLAWAGWEVAGQLSLRDLLLYQLWCDGFQSLAPSSLASGSQQGQMLQELRA